MRDRPRRRLARTDRALVEQADPRPWDEPLVDAGHRAIDLLTDRPCRTTRLPLIGAAGASSAGVPARPVRRYGSEAGDVAERALYVGSGSA